MTEIDKKIPAKAGIYRIRNILNGRVYVGSTINLKTRLRNHLAMLKAGRHSNSFLSRDFKKCGENSFIFEILEFIDDSGVLLMVEQKYLDELYDNCNNCYNMRKTATTGDWSKGDLISFSAKRKGIGNPMSGRKHSASTRKLMSFLQKKKVGQYTLNGALIQTFSSIEDAAKHIGVCRQMIGMCCNGVRKTSKGFIWRFYE